MELRLFDEVGDLVRSMVPDGLGTLRVRAHRRGVKVWFGPEKPIKEHYEAQFIPSRLVVDESIGGEKDALVVEVGFHSEYPDEQQNIAVVDRLLAERSTWSTVLGTETEAGEFLGNDGWRRVSEAWPDVDPEDPELAFELAGRLVDYIGALEPIRQEKA